MVRVVRAEGPAAERGRAIGRELGDPIVRSLAFYRELARAPRRRRGSPARRPVPALLPRRCPRSVALLEGMAAGAEVSAGGALGRERASRSSSRGRSSAARRFTALAAGATILAHNEQWLAGDAGNLAVVVEALRGRRRGSPRRPCLLPARGRRQLRRARAGHRLAERAATTGSAFRACSSPATRSPGVDLADAAARAALPGRAGGYAHVLARRGGEALHGRDDRDAPARSPGPAPTRTTTSTRSSPRRRRPSEGQPGAARAGSRELAPRAAAGDSGGGDGAAARPRFAPAGDLRARRARRRARRRSSSSRWSASSSRAGCGSRPATPARRRTRRSISPTSRDA